MSLLSFTNLNLMCDTVLSFFLLPFLPLQDTLAANLIAMRTSEKARLESLLSGILLMSPDWTTFQWSWRPLDGKRQKRNHCLEYVFWVFWRTLWAFSCKVLRSCVVVFFPRTGQDLSTQSKLNFSVPSEESKEHKLEAGTPKTHIPKSLRTTCWWLNC